MNTSYSTTSTAAGTGSTGNSETGITYDNMGNLLTLNRTGGTNAASLTYDGYNGTQLTSVKNAGASFRTYGTYDANGNAPSDGNGNTINYNLLNLPVSIPGKSLTYTYDAAGAKLRKVSGPTTTEYIDGIQYTGTTMDFVQTEEGRILNPTGTPNYEYTLTDHLGNSRVSFDSSHGGSTALQTEDYYPFGLIASQPYVTSPPNHYLYNRKELQDELTQYDYGARFYDPVIARWGVIDPMGEKFSMHSPYAYVGNNPMKMIDPTGAEEVDDDNGNTDIAATEATNTAASENPAAANAPCNPCQPGQDPNTPTIPLSKDPVKVNGDKDAGELAGVTIHGEKDKEPASEKVEKAVAPLDKAITTTQVVGLVSKTWSVIKDSPALKALGKLTGSITLVNNGRKALEAYNKGDKAGAAKYGLMTVGQGVAMAVGEEFELTWNVVNLSYEVLQKK